MMQPPPSLPSTNFSKPSPRGDCVKLPLLLEDGRCLWAELIRWTREPQLVLSIADSPFGEKQPLLTLTLPELYVLDDALGELRNVSLEWFCGRVAPL